jgi:hypothetical protein
MAKFTKKTLQEENDDAQSEKDSYEDDDKNNGEGDSTETDSEDNNESKDFEKLPYIIELKYPLHAGKKKITEIAVVRRLKTKDLSNIDVNKITFGHLAELAASISDVSIGIINELDISDFTAISAAVNYFLSGFQATGKDK